MNLCGCNPKIYKICEHIWWEHPYFLVYGGSNALYNQFLHIKLKEKKALREVLGDHGQPPIKSIHVQVKVRIESLL